MQKLLMILVFISSSAYGWEWSTPFEKTWDAACWAGNNLYKIGSKVWAKGKDVGRLEAENTQLKQRLSEVQESTTEVPTTPKSPEVFDTQFQKSPELPDEFLNSHTRLVTAQEHSADSLEKICQNTGDVTAALAAMSKASQRSARAAEVGNYIATVSVVIKAAELGKNIYNSRYPNEEQKAKTEHVKHRNELSVAYLTLIKARKALWECLVIHREGQKNNDGIPCGCQKEGAHYEQVAGPIKYMKECKAFRTRNGNA